MATLRIPEQNRTIESAEQISAFLKPFGMTYQRWPLEERVSPDASPEEILAAYASEIEVLKRAGGYVTADVINVTPDTPNLDTMLNKFNKEHRHSEDEVRFFVEGAGLFTMHLDQRVYEVLCEAGDLIGVPANTRHWFDMGPRPHFVAIRLFTNPAGWVAQFTGDTIAERFPRFDS